jgi:uncharacterized membrane protein YbhN (UPF0104 family)
MTTAEPPRSWLRSQRLRTAARVALSCAALIWILHSTPLRTIGSALAGAQLPLLCAGFALNFLARLAAAERTFVISRALGLMISRWQTVETLFISNFYALLSPGPILSGVVTVYRYRAFGASISTSLASLLASRVVECVSFVTLGTVCVLMDTRVRMESVRYPLWLASFTLLCVAVGYFAWWLLHQRWRRRTEASREPMAPGVGRFAALRALRHEAVSGGPGMIARAAIPGVAQAILAGAATAVLAGSLGFNLTLLTAIWITAAVYAVVLLPISVAGVGVREVTLVKALGLLGVGTGPAVALSILLFADPLINALIGGAIQLRTTISGVQRQT